MQAQVEREHDLSARWGVISGPSLWPVTLRILFVIDGRIITSEDPSGFGLGLVLATLRNDAFAPWVRFRPDVVRRDHGEGRPSTLGDTDYLPNPDPSDTSRGRFYFGFRFTDTTFNLDDYDQIWFFGDNPANNPGDPLSDVWSPLTDAELKLVAEWMDRGGGVFAAGDHFNLGASMCSRIPRVRTMRKWTVEQGVPSQFGNDRNETLQPEPGNPNATEDDEEADAFPQPIEPVNHSRALSALVRPFSAHPLLSGPHGEAIELFPDHMHEGEVIDDELVELDLPLNISGYEKAEYPFVQPEAAALAAGIGPATEVPRPRPVPHVVAYGRTTLPPTRRFGLISAYDGDRVGIGRVVVESTWHHWFSLNLLGLRSGYPFVYAHMQAYYRNVGLWLAGMTQRQSMLVSAVWGPVVTDPMGFPAESDQSLWAIGRKALGKVRRTLPEGALFDFVGAFFSGRAEEIFSVPADLHPADPCIACLPVDLVERAIVGGIAAAVIQPAADYYRSAGERRLLDPEAIARHAMEGAKQGHAALVGAVRDSAASAHATERLLVAAFRPAPLGPLPIELTWLRVTAERLQIPDPTDPALGGGRFTFTIQLTIGDFIVVTEQQGEMDLSGFSAAGGYIELDHILYEGVAQSGESLIVQALAGTAETEEAFSDRLRFIDIVDGRPSTWAGPHAPSRNQPWRLWYRIEAGAPKPAPV